MPNAQEWLNQKYPDKEERKIIEYLRASGKELEGHLDLSDFVKLRIIGLEHNRLTSLNVSKNRRLEAIRLYGNEVSANLNIFSHLVYLRRLDLGMANDFSGSLKALENCKWLEYLSIGQNGHLDLSGFVNLFRLDITANNFFPENKIIGLEKTSIIRLDLRGGDLLSKSKNPNFIWNVFVRKSKTIYPEMALIDISDLTELANQVNEQTANDKDFITKICPLEPDLFFKNFVGNFYWILDQLANRILARALIIQNRLYEGIDLEYEQKLTRLSLEYLKCGKMNPKYPQFAYFPTRRQLINRFLNGDLELINRIKDLPWIKKDLKKIITTISNLTNEKSTLEINKSELEKKLSDLQISKNNLETNLTTQIRQLRDKILTLRKQKSTLENQIRELEKVIPGLRSRLLTLSSQETQLKEKVKDLTNEKNVLAEKVANYDQIRNETLERIKQGKLLPNPKEEHLRAKYKEAYEENEHLRSLTQAYETDKVSYQKTLENWEASRIDLEAKRNNLQTEHDKLIVEHSQLENELAKTQTKIQELEAKEQDARQELTEKSAQLEQKNEQFSALQAQENKTSQQLAEKTQALENTNRELETTQSNLTNQIKQTKQLQEKLSAKQAELKTTSEQLAQVKNNFNSRQATLSNIETNFDEVRSELEQLANPKKPTETSGKNYWPILLLIPVFFLSLLIYKKTKNRKKRKKSLTSSESTHGKISLKSRNAKGQFTKKTPKRR